MASTIKLKNGSGAPTTGDLVQGEPALDLTNKRLYTENASGVVIEVGTSPSTIDINAGTIDGTVIGGTTAAAITGTTITGTSFVSSGDMTFGDNDKAIFGAGSDLQIYHDSNNSYIKDAGTGNLYISANELRIGNADNSKDYIHGNNGADVKLYYNNYPKLATTSTGIDVTGTVTADGLTVDGAALVRSGNTLTLNRTDNAVGGSMSYAAGTGFIFNDANGSGTSFNVGATNRMRIDSSGNVGIGTSSPTSLLHLSGTYPKITINDETGINRAFSVGTNNETFTIRNETGSADVLAITNTNNVGIGTSSPAFKLQVEAASDPAIASTDTTNGVTTLINSSNSAGVVGTSTNHPLVIVTNGTEAMRIDDSGNLLVGTTGGVFGSERVAVDAGSARVFVGKTTSVGNEIYSAWNSATSGDNRFAGFWTETAATERGSITYNRAGGLVVYNTTSDYRAKDIIGAVTDSGSVIDATPVYIGKMKGATQERPMFIAHEVPAYAQTGEKDAVDADGNPIYQQMDVSALVPVMWAEIQSLRARVAQLEGAN